MSTQIGVSEDRRTKVIVLLNTLLADEHLITGMCAACIFRVCIPFESQYELPEPLEICYQKLLKRDQQLFQQILRYHIARCLGVKPKNPSRLREKLGGRIY